MAFPKHSEVELPLLKALDSLGGKAEPKEVYPLVAKNFPELTEEDLIARLPSNDSTFRWHNLVQWVRQALVERGEIDGTTRGVWKLTDKGRTRLSDPQENRVDEHSLIDKSSDLDLPPGTGIEDEVVESSENIREPFDPTLIRVERETPTIDLLVSRMEHEEINLSPDFQRKGGIWTDDAQSRLIESILIRIPLPAFYVDATNENFWLVVDGLQRLTTLKRFVIDKTLALQGLEFLTSLTGSKFDALPRTLQRRIKETQITIFAIQAGTPETVKFNIFKRINTGGLPLSAQEIRNALNGDRVRQFLISLRDSNEFQSATYGAIKDKRMADRECVTRFLAFTLRSPDTYQSQDFDAFLNNAMKEINALPSDELERLREMFFKAMRAAHAIFGRFAFRKFLGIQYRLSPINKAIFETWAVNLAALDDSDVIKLVDNKDSVLRAFAQLMSDSAFDNAVSQGTGDIKKVRLRFRAVKGLIAGQLASP